MKIDITAVVLNEGETMEPQVKEANSFIRKNLSDLAAIRLVIADNGPADQTAYITKRLAAETENIGQVSL